MAPPPGREVRRVEILAVLKLATDLGMALPFEHGLRSTLIAIRLADLLKLDPRDRARVFDICLLYYLGCTADAATARGHAGLACMPRCPP